MNTNPAGIEISLRIGQRVRHSHDYKGARVTGTVQNIGIEEGALKATILLDEPIVIAPSTPGEKAIYLYRQHVLAHELTPFDERDQLLRDLLVELRDAVAIIESCGGNASTQRAAILDCEARL